MAEITVRGRDGIALRGDVYGDDGAPPVVLLHGGGQTRHAWGTTASALAESGWRAYTIDLRGHGDSDWDPNGDYSFDAFAADVAEVAKSLPQPPALVGASLGGISSLAAIAESDPQGTVACALVLVDVAPRIEVNGVARIGQFMTAHLDGFASLEEVADAVAAYNPHRPRPKDLAGLSKNVRQREDGRWYWHWDPAFVGGRFGSSDETRSSMVQPNRLADDARALTVPTLLVRGRMSDLLSEEGAKELLELVPHAELVDVAGAGHMVAGDRNDVFNDAVVSFLQRLPR
ncbi:MAG: alpha/beta fold hydrolase [Acidimicrobiales bacterium]